MLLGRADYESRLSLRQYASETLAIASLIPHAIIVFLQQFRLLLSRILLILSLFKTHL